MLRTRNTVGNKLSTNFKIITTVTMAIIFAFLSFLSFNTVSNNSSASTNLKTFGNKMYVVKVTVLNEPNIRWDYLMDQQIIGIKVETKGKRKAMCLDEMHFSLVGNSAYVMKHMETAFICYTKNDTEFSMEPIVTEEQDISELEEIKFKFKKVKLKEGSNYFWLVVKPTAGKIANPQDIVVECQNLVMNKVKLKPQIIVKKVPEKKIDPAVDFTF